MNTLHFFLTGALSQAPQRWRQAFVAGQELGWPQLLERCQALQAGEGVVVVWVSTSEAQWADRVSQLAKMGGHCQVVLLSASLQDEEALRALELGARGYGHVYSVPQLLREIALVVSHGGLWPGQGLVDRMVAATSKFLAAGRPAAAQADLSMLSARETEVARAVAAGQSNKEVAAKLGISERTVKAHLGAIFEKLGVRDRLQLVLYVSSPVPAAGTPGGH
ncbi:MAG: response regulator transcription factor [Acidovorax sp.]|nr:response regulator transcription factor [Acidovorax sp.]